MRYCPSCKINIEGEHKNCPLCQNGLRGEAEEPVYPLRSELKKQSLLYKIQMFIMIAVMLGSIGADYILELHGTLRYSQLVIMWVVGGEIWLYAIIRKHSNPSKVVAINSIALIVMMFMMFRILHMMDIYITWILPAICTVAVVLHFICTMLDRAHNAMVYLLVQSLVSVILAIVFIWAHSKKTILWVICLMLGVMAVVGALIFKGRKVTTEIQKRLNF